MEHAISPSLEQLRRNICQTYAGLGKHAPNSSLHFGATAWTCESPFEHPIGNFACHIDAGNDDIAGLISLALSKPSFRIYQVDGDSPSDLAARLQGGGLTERYRLNGMVFAGDIPTDAWPSLEAADTVRDVSAVAKFMVDTFFWRSKREIRVGLAEILSASAGEGQQFYWVRLNQLPIAAATLYRTDKVAGIYNVCVKVEERGRGIGASMVRELVRLASADGSSAFLQCDPALSDWYGRLGFKDGTQVSVFSS